MSVFKRVLKASVSDKAVLTDVENGIYWGPLPKKELWAYEEYFKQHPWIKKEEKGAPIAADVIDFIVDSFKIEPAHEEKEMKALLKKELGVLNQHSRTARALIKTLSFNQFISLVCQDDERLGYIEFGADKIILNRCPLGQNECETAVTLLHENAHLKEQEAITDFFEPTKAYYDHKNKLITDHYMNVSAKLQLKVCLLSEAEKKVQGDVIKAELMPSNLFLKTLVCGSFLSIQSPQNADLLVRAGYKIKIGLERFKLLLSSPFSLFSRQKREEMAQKAVLNVMAFQMKFLLQPEKKQQCHPLIQPKNNSLLNVFTFLGSLALLSLPVLSYAGIALPGALLGCLFIFGGVSKKFMADTKYAFTQKKYFWNWGYAQNAQASIRSYRLYRQGGKKKFQQFIKAFCHKYQNKINQSDMAQIKTMGLGAEKEVATRKMISQLDKKMQNDLSLLAIMQYLYTEKKFAQLSHYYWDVDLLEGGRKVFLSQGKKEPFQKVFEQFVLQEVEKSQRFDLAAKFASKEIIDLISTRCFKNAFYEKRKKLQQEEGCSIPKNKILIRKKEEREWIKQLNEQNQRG